jgi:hypothetical protein
MVVHSREFVHEPVGDAPGTTVTVGAVYRQGGDAVVGAETLVRDHRTELDPRRRRAFERQGYDETVVLLDRLGVDEHSQDRFYRLVGPGTFVVKFADPPTVPDGAAGIVLPHRSLTRTGVTLDAGTVGEDSTEALLTVEDRVLALAEDASIGRVVLAREDRPKRG